MPCIQRCHAFLRGCVTICRSSPFLIKSRPLLPSPPPPPLQSHEISPILILMVCVLGAVLLVISYCTVMVKYYSGCNRSRRITPPILSDTPDREDFLDEDQSPVEYHPIWLINTVGLQQSVIDLITVIKYNREEGLIEGTECSVCLNEFQEDESLRLLPKCSHAFHLPCIDTWLRSHKNCPLCRAPIFHENGGSHLNAVEQNSYDAGAVSGEDIQIDNLGTGASHQIGEGGAAEVGVGDGNVGELPVEDGRTAEIVKNGFPNMNARRNDLRVLSDLANNHRAGDEEIQPMRRSVSMDLSAASEIYLAMANVVSLEREGTSDTHSVQGKKMKILEIVPRRTSENSSLYKLMKSSSIGSSLRKGPFSMKRSLSSTGKFSFRRSRSRGAILLPL